MNLSIARFELGRHKRDRTTHPTDWLFAGDEAAAANHARLWSLIASCERHKVDPQRYLTSVLAKIGQTPHEELGQFLPDAWKTEDATEPIETEAC